MLARPSGVALFTGKLKINTFIKNSSSSMGLWESASGKMSAMTVESCQVFNKKRSLEGSDLFLCTAPATIRWGGGAQVLYQRTWGERSREHHSIADADVGSHLARQGRQVHVRHMHFRRMHSWSPINSLGMTWIE